MKGQIAYLLSAGRRDERAVTVCGASRLILGLRIDDLSDFRSTASTENRQREESLAEGGEPGVFSSHQCSVTLIVTVKL